MSNLTTDYHDLTKKVNVLNDTATRYEGKMETLQDNLKQAGFDSVEEAQKWMGKEEQHRADIESELKTILEETEEIIEEIERR